MNILLIDDDPASIFVTKYLLNRSGLFDDITTFDSPIEGLTFIQERILKESLPDIILLDINMPLMDGWQLLNEINLLNVSSGIYMLTSSTDIVDISRANDHILVTDILFKPMTIDKINEILKRLLLYPVLINSTNIL
jgi:CheY-like chemotaxis protein